jgi:chromosomal replication initiation ATPase DnaA
MKSDVINQYDKRDTDLFGISKEDLFSKVKKRDIVDARQMLYYLCYTRPIQISYIIKYMGENGYHIHYMSVMNGIKVVEEKMQTDTDYVSAVKGLQKSINV